MKRALFVLFCLLASTSLLAADGFSSLEEQMTGREFAAAGLDKLTPGELEALNEWIRSHSLGTLATAKTESSESKPRSTVAGGDLRGLPSDDGEDESPIRSAIVGDFNGWDGQTIFKLENGMIWVQDDRDKFYVREIENPVAVIERGMFGTWHLHVEGFRDNCKVKRIQ
jgi:hypothetical protein